MRRLLIALLLLAPLSAHAAPRPTCAAQQKALTTWLRLAAADRDRGAMLSMPTAKLVAVPLAKGSVPDNPAMFLFVEKGGVRDGAGPLVPTESTRTVIASNANVSYARRNPQGAARGILVAAYPDAPAEAVRAAVVAAQAAGERTWLLFRPADKRVVAPPTSPVTSEVATAERDGTDAFFQLIQRELGACKPFERMLRKLAGATKPKTLDVLIESPPRALGECKCKPSGTMVTAILWALAFEDLGVVVEIGPAVDTLPWGTGTWSDAAPAVVAALRG
jgi:hypothetical protein